ncbi:CKLF-like MARVEL transmembrane domain-containing protein 4 [Diorhabda sublineata]|uniref:CKLF-like MARVEL transmembrane domain-containing protein 4 n=1 Tax=Diorhabda sublineata TaxID=1163346 RepID=UPI0024E180E5|nr:CKLF-like MARVEL transmembrane domain-containing protein 4 [Diorhabda sublineata]XP_056635387.1 CKLF-like MARVEL transmembrane domain-containing protein 4 [Diorhabda sublineata]XP_056635388.1 CKLF-like MARVEL transmembrane domain-containing protein 4 [Diorhabda sublineata]XP_056635389.1 CKLF-like MARVEL transmembrane domain-containing protein 4 [Diorhabda sublineata]XP_056635390.1 CKLF-like MARVEL transmembrane domain-containing protein 4 [Diorhabda sublineata]XP_056635391.1 CKLF-like MARVE
MADPGFPGQHTTTTTVHSTNTTVQTNIRFDPSYVRTLPGIAKCAQLLLNLLGFICIESSGVLATRSRGSFFNFVAMFGFWFTGILLAFYLFHLIEKLYRVPWLKLEFVYCCIWTGFYMIASSLAVSYNSEAYIVAGVFGFCAMVVYGIDAFLKYKAVQNGEIAQGERSNNKQTTTVSSPAY